MCSSTKAKRQRKMERLLTVKELSDRLQVGKSTIYRWVHYEYIPHVKLGGALRFDEKSIHKWLKNREQAGRPHLTVEVDTFLRD